MAAIPALPSEPGTYNLIVVMKEDTLRTYIIIGFIKENTPGTYYWIVIKEDTPGTYIINNHWC